ncbi:19505_t:CDS:1, partial [Gigaspora margarita]
QELLFQQTTSLLVVVKDSLRVFVQSLGAPPLHHLDSYNR